MTGNNVYNHEMADGCMDDLIMCMDIIRDNIPEKASIDEEEIISRLQGIPHGVKITFNDEEVVGLSVWYEKTPIEAYLWLGAYNVRGRGLGSEALEEILQDIERIGYSRVSVKTAHDNFGCLRFLGRYGFSKPIPENGIYALQRSL